MTPKVKIVLGKVDEYFGLLDCIFLQDYEFKEECLSCYDGLKKLLDNSENKEDELRKYFKTIEKNEYKKLNNLTRNLKKLWEPINDKIIKAFEEIHEIKWTEKHKVFIARMVICPISPRYLNYNAFDIAINESEKELLDTILHELSPFIFFEKFKQIYPNTNPEHFESPHLIWKLSEIMPGIILQDKRIQKIFPNKELSVYDSIKKLKLNNKLILKTFKEFYDNKKDFTGFVKKSYEFMQKHKEEINKRF